MSLSLKKVVLENFRTHKNFIFEPSVSGITSLHGENGTGKSSITDSIAWALYGTKPNGVAKLTELFRTGSKVDSKSSKKQVKATVTVDLTVDGALIRIQRRMSQRGTTECDVWEILDENSETEENVDVQQSNISENSKNALRHLSGPSTTHSEQFIRKLLKMDERGFLTAILVQQKQVDNLITASSAERAKIIEKLTGISAITKAYEEANTKSRELNKQLKNENISEQEYNKIVKEFEKTIKEKEKTHTKLTTQKEKTTQTKNKGEEQKTKLKELEEKSNKTQNIQERQTQIETELKTREEFLQETTNKKNTVKKELNTITTIANIKAIKPEWEKLNKTINEKEYKQQTLQKENTIKNKTIETNLKTIEETKINPETIEQEINVIEQKINNNQKTQKETEIETQSLKTEVKKIERAIQTIQHENGTCPTCLQKIADIKTTTNIMHKEQQSIEEKITQHEKTIQELQEQQSQHEKAHQQIIQTKNIIQENQELQQTITNNNTELKKLQQELETLKKDYEKINKLYIQAQKVENIQQDYNELLKKAQQESETINSLLQEQQENNNTLKQHGTVSKNQIIKLREQYEKTKEQFIKEKDDYNETKNNYNLTNQNLTYITEKKENYKKSLDEHKLLIENVQIATNITETINEYRNYRKTMATPIIEQYASELLDSFTDGLFSGITLDEKFNAKAILSDGTERSVGLLSGGEMSAVAISLRLAISMLLNDSASSQNLIILDEVLVSQDESRAETILSTIKKVCQGQIIIIAHNGMIKSVSDKTIELQS